MGNVLEFFVKMKDFMSSGLAKIATNADKAFTGVENKIVKTISANKRLVNSLDEVKSKVGEVDRAANNSSFFSGSLFKKLAIGGALAAAVTIAGGFAKDSIGKAMDFGATKMSFQVLTGDKGKGEALSNELNKLQQDTILGPSVFKNAQTMMGFGIAAERVVPTLKMLGDVSMGDDERLGALTLAFSQVSAAGKLSGQDLLQMINAGYNPLNDISKMTGKSIGQLKGEMEKGAISSDMVTRAFEKATGQGGLYNNMLNTLAETPFGKMQQLSGAFESFQVKLGEAMMPLAGTIMKVLDRLLEIANVAIPYISQGIEYINSLFDDMRNPTSEIGQWMQIIGDYAFVIKDAMSFILGIVYNITSEMTQWVIKSEMLKDAFRIIEFFAGYIYFQIKLIFQAIETVWDRLIKPQLDRMEYVYTKVKSLLHLGGGDVEITGSVKGGGSTAWQPASWQAAGMFGSKNPLLLDQLSKASASNISTAQRPGEAMKGQSDEVAKGVTNGGPRTINIAIGKLVEKIEIHAMSGAEGLRDMESQVQEIFLRILHSGATVQ